MGHQINSTYVIPTSHAKPLYGAMVQVVWSGRVKREFLPPEYPSPEEAIKAGEKLAAKIKKSMT